MLNPNPSSHSDPDVLTRFQEGLAKAATLPGLARASAALWPRFAGYYYQGLARLPRKVRRALPLWRCSLGSLALLCALASVPAMAATINVGVNACTLVDAITAANSSVATGGCPAGSEPFPASGVSGADTIVLPTNSVHTLTAVNSNLDGPNGLPVITSELTIQGNGSIIRRGPGAPEFRILSVQSGGNLTLDKITVSKGIASASASASGCGGGIRNFGTLAIIASTIESNTASCGGGLGGPGAMTLTNSTVSGNFAEFGGGIGTGSDHRTTLINSTVTSNSASDHAGGIDNFGTLRLFQTLVSGNSASVRAPEINNHEGGAVNANNWNLFGHDGDPGAEGFTPGETDIVPNEPVSFILDAALTDTGGPTKTHNLIINSPAIDAAPTSNGSCVNNADQRGFFRPNDGNADGVFDCDIGSVEAPTITIIEPPLPLPPPPRISTASLPSGTRGQPYGSVLAATGGVAPLRWSGVPPAGLSLSQTGAISGTPVVPGNFFFGVTVTDSASPGRADTRSFQIIVSEPPVSRPAPEAAPTVPNPPVPCTSAGCSVRLTCPLSLSPVAGCINRVNVFVTRRVLRSTGAALKASGRVLFCSAIANVPAGQTLSVKLRPTTRGRAIIRAGNRKSLRGRMEISNAAGAISNTPVRIRVR